MMSVSKELLEKKGCYWCRRWHDKTCNLETYKAWTEKEMSKIWHVGDVYYYVGDACENFDRHAWSVS